MGYSYIFKDLEFDFSNNEKFSHWDFMLSEFFNASKELKNDFRKAYLNLYGAGPYNYMMNNHWYGWERGSKIVSDTQSFRIYYLMQNLLDDSGKHRLGMNEFMMSIKSTVKGFIDTQRKTYSTLQNLNNSQELIQVFVKELERIQLLTLVDIKARILSQEEKKEALEISKYILEIKLQKIFDQIERDFVIFLPFMLKLKRNVFSANYLITNFNLKLDITNTGIEDVEIPKFKIKEIEINSRFKDYSDKYLAYEFVSINHEVNKAVSNSFLNINDMEIFYKHYEELSKGQNEASLKSEFKGEGGQLNIILEIKSLNKLKLLITYCLIRILIYLSVFIYYCFTALKSKYTYSNIALSIFVFINIFSLLLFLFYKELKYIKKLKLNLIKYGYNK